MSGHTPMTARDRRKLLDDVAAGRVRVSAGGHIMRRGGATMTSRVDGRARQLEQTGLVQLGADRTAYTLTPAGEQERTPR